MSKSRRVVLVLALLGIAAFGLKRMVDLGWVRNPWAKVESAPPARRLAPPGVVYAIAYSSFPIAGGVIGIEPGRKLTIIEDRGSTLLVDDGKYRGEVPVQTVTNDLDIATLAQQQDADSQAQLAAAVAVYQAEAANYEAAARVADAKARNDLDARRVAAGSLGGVNRFELSDEDKRRNEISRNRYEGQPRMYYVPTNGIVVSRAAPLVTPAPTSRPGIVRTAPAPAAVATPIPTRAAPGVRPTPQPAPQ